MSIVAGPELSATDVQLPAWQRTDPAGGHGLQGCNQQHHLPLRHLTLLQLSRHRINPATGFTAELYKETRMTSQGWEALPAGRWPGGPCPSTEFYPCSQ